MNATWTHEAPALGRRPARYPRAAGGWAIGLTILLLLTTIAPAQATADDGGPSVEWARNTGSNSSTLGVQGRSVAMDAESNATVAGVFVGEVTFGEGDEAVVLTAPGGNHGYLASYDSDGGLRWANRLGGGSGVYSGSPTASAQGVAIDATGNATVTGNFSQMATFGDGDEQVVFDSDGTINANAFVANYDPHGTLRWVNRIGQEEGRVYGLDVAVDAPGGSTVTGRFGGSATFGEGDNATTLVSAGDDDLFLASYGPNGEFRWAHRAGGEDRDDANGVAVDANGNSTITGRFRGSATFGEGGSAVTLVAPVGNDVFVASYDPDGALRWVRQASTNADHINSGAWGRAVAADGDGNVIVTGRFAQSLTFVDGNTEITLVSAGSTDAFVASYDPDGALRWVRRDGGAGRLELHDVVVDAADNAIITGSSEGASTFGDGDDAISFPHPGSSSSDAFVVSYDGSGAVRWGHHVGGSSGVQGHGVAVDADDNVSVHGVFHGEATFGDGDVTLEADGRDMFVARYSMLDTQGPVTSEVSVNESESVAYATGFTVTATVDDTTSGGSDIAGAEYAITESDTEPQASDWLAADAIGFTGPVGDVTVTVDDGLAVGSYQVCVRGTDTAGNTGDAACIGLAVFDDDGPITGEVSVDPEAVTPGAAFTITAAVDDTTTGGSAIAAAEYAITDAGTQPQVSDWLDADAVGFDGPSGDVTATVDEGLPVGDYQVCVRATDTAGNTGDAACIELIIADDGCDPDKPNQPCKLRGPDREDNPNKPSPPPGQRDK